MDTELHPAFEQLGLDFYQANLLLLTRYFRDVFTTHWFQKILLYNPGQPQIKKQGRIQDFF